MDQRVRLPLDRPESDATRTNNDLGPLAGLAASLAFSRPEIRRVATAITDTVTASGSFSLSSASGGLGSLDSGLDTPDWPGSPSGNGSNRLAKAFGSNEGELARKTDADISSAVPFAQDSLPAAPQPLATTFAMTAAVTQSQMSAFSPVKTMEPRYG
jgi:hypothetical protein